MTSLEGWPDNAVIHLVTHIIKERVWDEQLSTLIKAISTVLLASHTMTCVEALRSNGPP